jgi:hypothetical protein
VIKVQRLKVLADRHQFEASIRWEASFHGLSLYSLTKAFAIRFAPLRYVAKSDALICSELITTLYRDAGIDLTKGAAEAATPNSLAKNLLFKTLSQQVFSRHKTLNEKACQREVDEATMGWIGAFFRSLSFSRMAWSIPVQRWRFWHYLGYTVSGALDIHIEAIRLKGAKFLNRPSLRERLLAKDPSHAQNRKLLEATIAKMELEIDHSGGVERSYYVDYKQPWRDSLSSRPRHWPLIKIIHHHDSCADRLTLFYRHLADDARVFSFGVLAALDLVARHAAGRAFRSRLF